MFVTAFVALNAFSSPLSNITIQNHGKLSRSIMAGSGSPPDIQAAVDTIAGMGGGNVCLPEGTFTFDISQGKTWDSGQMAGVIIPGGVNVIGGGASNTILREPTNPTSSGPMFLLDGINGKPIRISGIYFKGFCDDEAYSNVGISVYSVTDFRIDHCNFTDFSGYAIWTSKNWRQSYPLRGLIDHCNIDNPYKDNVSMGDYTHRLWSYGIGCQRDDFTWIDNVDSILGHYDDNPSVVYIEDCNFRRCRHEISANGGAHYVARHNTFSEMIVSWYGSYCDAHGSTGNPPAVGTRLVEIYDNTFINSPTDYRSTDQQNVWGSYRGIGVGIRGGAAMIFNNTFQNFDSGLGMAIKLYSDASDYRCRPTNIYIWNNAYQNCPNHIGVDNAGTFPITENVDYFQFAKTGYVPYPYPHPLISSTQ